MRSWLHLLAVAVVLTFCSGGFHKMIAYSSWVIDGAVAFEQAVQAMEERGVSGKVTPESGPSAGRQLVAGRIRRDGKVYTFCVHFNGKGTARTVSRVEVGGKILPPPSTSE